MSALIQSDWTVGINARACHVEGVGSKKGPPKKGTEEAVPKLPEVIVSETSQKIFKRNSWGILSVVKCRSSLSSLEQHLCWAPRTEHQRLRPTGEAPADRCKGL